MSIGGGPVTGGPFGGAGGGTSAVVSGPLTYTDIETRVLNQLRLPITATEQAKVRAVINEVYRDIYAKQDFWFFQKRAIINTVAKYDTGTANVANGNTSVTLSAAPAVGLGSFERRKFFVLGDTGDSLAFYRITSHAAGSTALVLDGAFTGDTNTAAGFRIYGDTYSLPSGFGKLLKAKRFGRWFPAQRTSQEEMEDIKTWDTREGKPDMIAVYGFATDGDPTTQRQLVVHPYPDQTYRMELWYKQGLNTELEGTTEPLIPDEYRQILIYGALARGYPIFLADVERGAFFQNLFNDMLNLMVSIHREYDQNKPQFAPKDVDRWRHRTRHRGRVSLGSYFDIWPQEP